MATGGRTTRQRSYYKDWATSVTAQQYGWWPTEACRNQVYTGVCGQTKVLLTAVTETWLQPHWPKPGRKSFRGSLGVVTDAVAEIRSASSSMLCQLAKRQQRAYNKRVVECIDTTRPCILLTRCNERIYITSARILQVQVYWRIIATITVYMVVRTTRRLQKHFFVCWHTWRHLKQ